MKKITIYDTTLRDGSQTDGVSFSVNDKIKIAERLDELGVHYIEGGWPGSNPKDQEFFAHFKDRKMKNAVIAAFGSTRRANIKSEDDVNLNALIESGAKTLTIFGKTWDLHVIDIIKTTLEENLQMIKDSVSFLKLHDREVFYDAEHFFDGYKNNPDYALKTVLAAQEAGADCIVFCDTNGGTLPDEIREIVLKIKDQFTAELGIHCHDDLDMGVADSLAAVDAGCTHIQGTFNGLGERCGNGNLATIIGVLQTKMGMEIISEEQLGKLMDTCYFIGEISNWRIPNNAGFIGHSAFAHKGGVHIDAVIKNSTAYEHIVPERVGNHRRFVTSELAGKMPIVQKAESIGVKLEKKSPEAQALLKAMQEKELDGYQYEAADASFELFVKRELKMYEPFFSLESFRTASEKRSDGQVFADASIRVNVDGKSHFSAAEGNGPVEALDKALRGALVEFYPSLKEMSLSDYKVRVLDSQGGTGAKVRVLIESHDAHDTWTTVGVHENIIEASWESLIDGIEYKLLKDQTG